MQGDSSLTLRMTLTQCFKKLNCHSEHSEESQTQTFRKEPIFVCLQQIIRLFCINHLLLFAGDDNIIIAH